MKKTITLLLTLILMISLCACSGNNDKTDETANQSNKSKTEQTGNSDNKAVDLDCKIEYCRFADDLYGSDEEIKSWGYSQFEDQVYVVLSVIVTNKSASAVPSDKFSGYCIYDDLRNDMQLAHDNYAGGVADFDEFPADATGRLFMFTKLPEDAQEDNSLEVVCNLNGKEQTVKIEQKDTRSALEKKTELKKGDKEHLPCGNGSIDFEVLSCTYSKYLRTTDVKNSKQYSGIKPYIDVILKVTNNVTPVEGADGLDSIFGYILYGDTQYRGEMKIETNNNTELGYGVVGWGKTEIVHIYASIEEGADITKTPFRFNLLGNCYYIYAEENL